MCGFTAGNYPQLQELHRKYSEQGLSVLGSIIMLCLFHLGQKNFLFIYIFFSFSKQPIWWTRTDVRA